MPASTRNPPDNPSVILNQEDREMFVSRITRMGTLNTAKSAIHTNIPLVSKCIMPCHLVEKDLSDPSTSRRCLRAVSAPPLFHRYCCVFTALITGGNSEGEPTS